MQRRKMMTEIFQKIKKTPRSPEKREMTEGGINEKMNREVRRSFGGNKGNKRMEGGV